MGLTPSRNSITVRWSPPAEDGRRTDLYYEVIRSDHNDTRSYNTKVYRNTNSRSYTFSGLNPFTEYCVKVTAHNGVSDQDPDGTHLRTIDECVTTLEGSSSAASACTESVAVVGGVFSLISVLIIGVLIIIVLIKIHNLKAMLTQAKE